MTKKQQQCLDFIKSFIDANGHSPSIAEISDAMGMNCRGAATMNIIIRLEEDGYITRTPRRARSIQLVKPQWESIGMAAERLIKSIRPKNITEDINDKGQGTVTLTVDAVTFGDLDVAVREQNGAHDFRLGGDHG